MNNKYISKNTTNKAISAHSGQKKENRALSLCPHLKKAGWEKEAVAPRKPLPTQKSESGVERGNGRGETDTKKEKLKNQNGLNEVKTTSSITPSILNKDKEVNTNWVWDIKKKENAYNFPFLTRMSKNKKIGLTWPLTLKGGISQKGNGRLLFHTEKNRKSVNIRSQQGNLHRNDSDLPDLFFLNDEKRKKIYHLEFLW